MSIDPVIDEATGRRAGSAPARFRLAVVTSRFPNGTTETFLGAEIAQLAQWSELSVFPAISGMFSLAVVADAVRETLRAPARVIRCFLAVVLGPRSLRAKLKNAAIFPKALSVARRARSLGVEHVHAYWLSAPATVAFVVSRVNGIPWSATAHRYDLVDFNMSVLRGSAGIVRDAAFVRTISLRGRAAVQSVLPPVRSRSVHAISLGIRLPPPAPARRSPQLRLICAAALVPVKDHATLLRALRRALDDGADVACTLAGQGPERARLEALASGLRLGNIVEFEGFVPHGVLLQRLADGAYDAAVLTSLDRGLVLCEGVPVFLMEAMGAGVPCIATASGSVAELIEDERNGLLCEPGDVAAVARAIVRLSHDPALRMQLGAAARETIEMGYDVSRTGRAVASLLGIAGSRREAVLA